MQRASLAATAGSVERRTGHFSAWRRWNYVRGRMGWHHGIGASFALWSREPAENWASVNRQLASCSPYAPGTNQRMSQKVMAATAAAAGIVRIQAHTMRPATPQRTAESRPVAPTPTIAPVMVWVVLTGI